MTRSRVLAAILLLWPASSLLAQAGDPPFTWKVPSRFGIMNSAGLIEYHWNADLAEYDSAWVKPTQFPVAFNACQQLTEPVSWTFRDSTNTTVIEEKDGCATEYAFAANHTTYMA